MNKENSDKLISQYQKKIFGFALTKFSSLSQAEELAADIVCEVYRSLLKTDEIANVDGYVYRIAKNIYAQHIRRMKNNNTVSIDELLVPPAYAMQETETENIDV